MNIESSKKSKTYIISDTIFQTDHISGSSVKICIQSATQPFLVSSRNAPPQTAVYNRLPMNLFLKISVLQAGAKFCWLGDLEKILCPWNK